MSIPNQQSHRWLLIAILSGSIAAALNGSILNVAVPIFMEIFQSNITLTQWIVSCYILAAGLISPLIGYFNDRFGYKKLYIFALVAILVASALCALSTNLYLLIACRTLQGIAGGMIMPLTLAMIYQLLPREEQAQAVSLWNVSNIGGNLLGPVLAAWLLSYLPWQGLFLIGWPLILLALILSCRLLPELPPAQQKARPDLLGMSMVSVCTVMALVAFSNSNTWGWKNPVTIGCVVLCIVGVIGFVWRCLRSAQPLLNFAVFKYRGYVRNLILDFICYNNTYAFLFVVPLLFQNGFGFTIFETSLVTLPTALMMTLCIPVVGRLYNQHGPRKLLFCGALILLLASTPLLFLAEGLPPWAVIGSFMCRSIGLSFITTAAINMGMSALPKSLASHGSAMANWLKQVLGSVVISLCSAFMLIRIHVYQAEAQVQLSSQFYLLGTRDIFLYMIGIILLAFPILWAIPKQAPSVEIQDNI